MTPRHAFFRIFLSGILIFLAFAVVRSAFAQPTGPLPQILPTCDPLLPPNSVTGTPCGIPKFFELLRNIITWLTIIATPVGVVLISYGAFLIMIAGGRPGMHEQGKRIIEAAVVGLIITFCAWLIIYLVYTWLQVKTQYRPI